MTAYVKVRMPGEKRFLFLSGQGLNGLRVHAARFDTLEKAQAVIDANKDDPENVGIEWKVTS